MYKPELGKKTPLEETRIPHQRPHRTSKTPLSFRSVVEQPRYWDSAIVKLLGILTLAGRQFRGL
jgi:hypothetical protein